MNRKYTKTDVNNIIRDHLKGRNDREISEEYNIGLGFVQQTTTDYWNHKMKKKDARG